MKRLLYILFVWTCLTACTSIETLDRISLPDYVSVIDSYAQGMRDVTTRSSKKERETIIQTRSMMIFDSEGKRFYFKAADGHSISFIIDRSKEPFSSYGTVETRKKLLSSCTIYIVANTDSTILKEQANTIDELFKVKYTGRTTIHPDKDKSFYFPMIGARGSIDFYYDENDQNTHEPPPVQPIPLQTLYSKIEVNIQVKTDQSVPGEIPHFRLNTWEVLNAPKYTQWGSPDSLKTEETDPVIVNASENFISSHPQTEVSGSNPASGSHTMHLEFYVLEHWVNPGNFPYTYPEGVHENEKQRFKPLLCKETQKPLIVRLNGQFSDHQGHLKEVRYDLYLGEDNHQDFHVKRNTLYHNNVTIKGLKKFTSTGEGSAEGDLSVDHRVVVNTENEDVIIKIERETNLDSHIEIRPIDVFLKNVDANGQAPEGTYVQVEIVNPDTRELIQPNEYTWVRFEKKSSANTQEQQGNYCSNGKRKYFTTNLLSDLNVPEGVQVKINNNNDNRVWVYFDENLNVSVNGMRTAMLCFSFYENNKLVKQEFYKFMQHDLYPVTYLDSAKRSVTCGIEYYEEYLYSFDPKDPYANRTVGMPWGQNGLYSQDNAIIADNNIVNSLIDIFGHALKEAGGKYDYTGQYKGEQYTRRLIEVGDGKNPFSVLRLDELPRSAAEYCFNKNKRDANGNVVKMDWYLPAIGEIQGIATAAYGKFTEFQDSLYWSSQTSYRRNQWESTLGSGDFLSEVLDSARSTKVLRTPDGKFVSEPSEANGYFLKLTKKLFQPVVRDTIGKSILDKPGNQPRHAIHRVRAIRKLTPKK